MSSVLDRIPPRLQAASLRVIFALPSPLLRRLAGAPIRRDGQELAAEAQLLLAIQARAGMGLVHDTPERSREMMRRGAVLIDGPRVEPVGTRELTVPGDAGVIGCRLYVPHGLPEGSALLVFYHGGGWVIGDLDTHDNLCRFLAQKAGVRVLSVDYRLAPEHPAPAAADDALAAYRYARENAAGLGVDAGRIALGGDSAGGNLAAVTALSASGAGLAVPAFLLLLYPGTDATVRRRSRELFGDGFLLTDADMTWFMDQYVAEVGDRADPRVSPMYAGNLAELPPTYLLTAGFDPLRDEGEAFAAALTEAGVPVVLHRHPDLIHGFANLLGVGHRFREAVFEAAGALRTGLGLAGVERVGVPAPERG